MASITAIIILLVVLLFGSPILIEKIQEQYVSHLNDLSPVEYGQEIGILKKPVTTQVSQKPVVPSIIEIPSECIDCKKFFRFSKKWHRYRTWLNCQSEDCFHPDHAKTYNNIEAVIFCPGYQTVFKETTFRDFETLQSFFKRWKPSFQPLPMAGLKGTLIDSLKRPVSHRTVWLTAGLDPLPEACTDCIGGSTPVQVKAVTDEHGSFSVVLHSFSKDKYFNKQSYKIDYEIGLYDDGQSQLFSWSFTPDRILDTDENVAINVRGAYIKGKIGERFYADNQIVGQIAPDGWTPGKAASQMLEAERFYKDNQIVGQIALDGEMLGSDFLKKTAEKMGFPEYFLTLEARSGLHNTTTMVQLPPTWKPEPKSEMTYYVNSSCQFKNDSSFSAFLPVENYDLYLVVWHLQISTFSFEGSYVKDRDVLVRKGVRLTEYGDEIVNLD